MQEKCTDRKILQSKYLYYIWHKSASLYVTHRYQIWKNPWKIWLCSNNYGQEDKFSRRHFWVDGDYGGGGSFGGCRVPRASRSQFFRNSPNRIFGPGNAKFCTEKKFLDAIVGWSTTLRCLGLTRTDFSEYHQIAYLYPKILILKRKKFGCLSLSFSDSNMPRAIVDRFFRMPQNLIFGS